MQPRHSPWPWILVAVLVAAAAAWLFRDNLSALMHGAAPAPAAVAPAAAPPVAPPAPAAAAPPPPIQHPIDPAAAADAAIPALADSDAAAWAELATLAGSEAPLALLIRDHLIQRAVTMIDNLPQRRVAARTLALKPVPGRLQISTDAAGASSIAEANAQRYAAYVQAFTQADPGAMVAAYRRFYPLFQQAYVELGYPKGYFNDRLVQVIDHLLQAPLPATPPALSADTRTGKYRFVDPALESLSVGQKVLLRLGPVQAAAVRKQLQAIRAALVRT
ncbi:DUF3014 domain-containing protein [Xanthomonas graminis]|uniref:DUF3014 domain-containing protein n=2 Tax=Xanthomonas translucens group TaxID=3390202 RepID=A0A1M4ID10_9XANT|nr:DUF3014 domain-containing protein [Xanthomonas translucens]OAX59935.1 hypothetical protein A6R72_00260 [Xanthomonas translucens pv. graminis]UKE53614.1 DUF3014 domain-containing protein [Xanthomonas translucens pv. graminis]WIH07929.1 DUF3014 domain-containing protein [Xanthomonas translucens pv. graminis]WIH13312.1 DUF3014 domain-containing protein [Xanthomonas translucens pv. graminis]WIH16909.1 DUF3014 domain-containing protein [Xanthomonas translucens pv. graminis]